MSLPRNCGWRAKVSTLLSILCVIALEGCSQSEPSKPSTPAAVIIPIKTASQANKLIAFDDLQFESHLLRERLAKVELAARTIALPTLRYDPWQIRGATGATPETHVLYSTAWYAPHNREDRACVQSDNPCHRIYISASPRDSKLGQLKVIHSWSLQVQEHPAEVGWGVHMHYGETWNRSQQLQEHIQLWLYGERFSTSQSSKASLQFPRDGYALKQRIGMQEYHFGAIVKGNPIGLAKDCLSSPVRLSELMLANQDKLESLTRAQIESDNPAQVTDYDLMVSKPPTGNPPIQYAPSPTVFVSPIPANYALTSKEKEELLQQMTIDFEQRRKLIIEQAAEIHAAIHKAFPLSKVLAELDALSAAATQ